MNRQSNNISYNKVLNNVPCNLKDDAIASAGFSLLFHIGVLQQRHYSLAFAGLAALKTLVDGLATAILSSTLGNRNYSWQHNFGKRCAVEFVVYLFGCNALSINLQASLITNLFLHAFSTFSQRRYQFGISQTSRIYI